MCHSEYIFIYAKAKNPRTISSKPRSFFFKPQGICLKEMEIIELCEDEYEAIKLHDFDHLSQIQAAQSMNISQPTFGRTLNSGYKKISKALFEGKAIAIQQQKGKSDEENKYQKHFNYSHLMCDVCNRHCLAE